MRIFETARYEAGESAAWRTPAVSLTIGSPPDAWLERSKAAEPPEAKLLVKYGHDAGIECRWPGSRPAQARCTRRTKTDATHEHTHTGRHDPSGALSLMDLMSTRTHHYLGLPDSRYGETR